MKRNTKIYTGAVSFVGVAAAIACSALFFRDFDLSQLGSTIVLAVLLVLCRSLPLYVREDCAVDMSFISILTIFLLEGPVAAAALYFLTTPFIFVVEKLPGEGRAVSHIFNTPLIKTAYHYLS